MALKAGRVGVNPNYVDKEGRPLYDNSYLKELLRKEGIITLFTKEGNPISIDNAVAGRVYDLVVNMSPKQAGTGTPSPTNVREITGYTGLTITVNGTDIERDFDTTVYGGSDDITGEGIRVTWGTSTLNGSEDWSASSVGTNFHQFTLSTSTMLYTLGILCDKLPTIQVRDRGTISGIVEYGSDSLIRISLNDDEYDITTLSAFKEWLSNNNLQVVYQLKTPTTIPLTVQAVAFNTGSNVIRTDTGTTMALQYLGTLVTGGANGRSLNRSLSLNREVIDREEKKEIQEEIKEVPVEEPVTVKKSTKKSTK